MKFETDYIEKLAKVLADTGLTEISLEDGEQAITLRKDVVGKKTKEKSKKEQNLFIH